MGPLVFRVDPTQLDPVWLESVDGDGRRIVPSFTSSFHPRYEPDLVVVDDRGQVVARDGLAFAPDRALAGHVVCPAGDVVTLD